VRTAGNTASQRAASRQVSTPGEADLGLAQDDAFGGAIAGLVGNIQSEICRVLIVDDDELVTNRICSLLEQNGYQVCTARSGDEALRVLDSMTCHIIVTDWHMPDMDGLELCREIRSKSDRSYIYILVLTVRNGSGDILAALSAGADDYVVKGATAGEILARLEVGRRIS
jgi:DNA-binding response OmpR family regulator